MDYKQYSDYKKAQNISYMKRLRVLSGTTDKLVKLKNEINFQKLYLAFSDLRERISGTNTASSMKIIKQFLFLNQVVDTTVFSLRNFDNLINFLNGDFKNKLDKNKSIRENLIDILAGAIK